MNVKSMLMGAALTAFAVSSMAQPLPTGAQAVALYAVFPHGQQFQVGVYASPDLCDHYRRVADLHLMTPMVRQNHGRYLCIPVHYVPSVPPSGCVMGCGRGY
jgi:hypothetical protein